MYEKEVNWRGKYIGSERKRSREKSLARRK